MYDFDATLAELERFLGSAAEATATFSEVGDQLPPTASVVVTLRDVRIVTESVARPHSR